MNKRNSDSDVQIVANAPYGYANGLSCVSICYTETLLKTHAKAGQHHAELKVHFVANTE